MIKNSNKIHINSGRGQNNFPLNTFWYSTRPMDWFHTTLYTRVLVNITKLMKNHPICGARFSVNIWNSLKIFSSLHLPPFQNVVVWFKSSNIDGETCTTVLSVFFVWFQPQKYLSLFGALFFSFALVHTWVRQVRNYYSIMYITKKNHFTWTSTFNHLIGIFSFFCLSSQ